MERSRAPACHRLECVAQFVTFMTFGAVVGLMLGLTASQYGRGDGLLIVAFYLGGAVFGLIVWVADFWEYRFLGNGRDYWNDRCALERLAVEHPETVERRIERAWRRILCWNPFAWPLGLSIELVRWSLRYWLVAALAGAGIGHVIGREYGYPVSAPVALFFVAILLHQAMPRRQPAFAAGVLTAAPESRTD